MKFKLILILFLLTSKTFGQGIVFFEGTWEEALIQAKETNKLIFLDAYASWCGPCKQMSKFVFTDSEVGEYYNSKFINVKMDMEKGEGPKLASKYPIQGYPSFLFVDSNGKIVHKDIGGKQTQAFINLGKSAFKLNDQSEKYEKKYENGDRTTETVYDYIKALNNAEKSSLKIANEYLNEYTGVKNLEYYKIVFEASQESDSKPFEIMIKNLKSIQEFCGKEATNQKIYDCILNTAKKSVKFKSHDLLEKANSNAKIHLSKHEKAWFDAEFDFFKNDYISDLNSLLDSGKKILEVANKSKLPRNLNPFIAILSSRTKDQPNYLSVITEFYKQRLTFTDKPMYRLEYGIYLNLSGKKEEALNQVRIGREQAEKLNQDLRPFDAAKNSITGN